MANVAVNDEFAVTEIEDRNAHEMEILRAIFDQASVEGGFTRRQLIAIFRRFSQYCHVADHWNTRSTSDEREA